MCGAYVLHVQVLGLLSKELKIRVQRDLLKEQDNLRVGGKSDGVGCRGMHW